MSRTASCFSRDSPRRDRKPSSLTPRQRMMLRSSRRSSFSRTASPASVSCASSTNSEVNCARPPRWAMPASVTAKLRSFRRAGSSVLGSAPGQRRSIWTQPRRSSSLRRRSPFSSASPASVMLLLNNSDSDSRFGSSLRLASPASVTCVLRRSVSDFSCASRLRTASPASVTSVFSSASSVSLGRAASCLTPASVISCSRQGKTTQIGEAGQQLDVGVGGIAVEEVHADDVFVGVVADAAVEFFDALEAAAGASSRWRRVAGRQTDQAQCHRQNVAGISSSSR